MQFYFETNEDDNNFVTRYDFKHIDEFMPLSIISKNCAKIKNALHTKNLNTFETLITFTQNDIECSFSQRC